jgi:plastocyanin
MRSLLVTTAISIATLAHASSGLTMHRAANVDVAVVIRTFQYAPDTLRVPQSTRVVWSNGDEIEHTVTSGDAGKPDGHFNGVVEKRGATYAATLEKAGTYSYFGDRHRFMQGTIIVTR